MGQSCLEGGVSGQIPRLIGSIATVATLFVSGAGVGAPANIAGPHDCLAAPNSPPSQGIHWYYRLDRVNQRKCWYLRAPGQPAQQAAAPATMESATPSHSMPVPSGPKTSLGGAPMSVSPGDAAPSPHAKLRAVQPKPAQLVTATKDRLVQRSAQEGDTAPSMIEAQASAQTGAEAEGLSSAAPVVWPDASPAVATDKAQGPILDLTSTPPEAVSDDAERTVRGGRTTNKAGMPIIIFPILALVLAAGGILFRVAMKIATARRTRTTIDYFEPDRINDQLQHEWRDDQDQQGCVDERQEYYSPISAVSDCGPPRAESDASLIAHKISKRRDKLAQLRQDLDRLLQSPKEGPHHNVSVAFS